MTGSLEGVVCGNIGVGAVGTYWTRFQKKEGADILVYDKNEQQARQVAEDYGGEAVDLDTLLRNSDWTSVSVLPLREVFAVMEQIGEWRHLLKPGSFLMDHSGVKTGKKDTLDVLMRRGATFTTALLKAVEGRDDVEAGTIHLAFRPDVEFEGQNVYTSQVKPAEGGLWMPKVTGLLTSYGANVYQMTPEQQDLITFRHQMLIWMPLFVAFDAIRKSGSDTPFPEMEKFTTKLSKPFFDLMKRMTSGNWRVYWDTMVHHPFAVEAATLLEQSMHELRGKLVQGEDAGASFEVMYSHLKAIAESSSPERKTGKPLMVEIYYEHAQRVQVQQALRLEELPSSPFSGNVVVSMIDGGRINELHRAGIPAAAFTTYGHRDRRKHFEIAFYVRNVPHPEHSERKGMRFSPMIPKDLEKAQQINPDYTRLQLERLHRDPVVNFFMNVKQDPALSQLPPFVVYKPL